MGLAYSVGLVLIYLLVVGQFKSYAVPLFIRAPKPLLDRRNRRYFGHLTGAVRKRVRH